MKRILPLLLAVACTTEPEKTPSTPPLAKIKILSEMD